MNNGHCTTEQLNALLDGRLEGATAAGVRLHLEQCASCSRALQVLRTIDGSLRGLPLERAPENLSSKVLQDLHLVPGTSWLFRLVSNAGYVFGVLLVLGAMAAAFILTGVLDTDKIVQQGRTAAEVGAAVFGWMDALSAFLVKYVPFLFASGSSRTVVMIAAALAALAALDRLLLRHLPHRYQKMGEG